jgi:hypothetical protein
MMPFPVPSRGLSPNLRAEFPSSWRHPFPRVVHALTNLPSWNIFHDPGLLLKILLPLFDKSTICEWTMDNGVMWMPEKNTTPVIMSDSIE